MLRVTRENAAAVITLASVLVAIAAGPPIAGKDPRLVSAAGLWGLYLCWHLYRRTRADKWPSVPAAVDALARFARVPLSDDSATAVVHSDGMRAALALGWTLVIAHVAYGLLVLVTLGQGHDWLVVAIAPSAIVANVLLPVWAVLLVWRFGTDPQPSGGSASEVGE